MAGEQDPKDPTSTAPAEVGAPATQTPVRQPQGSGQRKIQPVSLQRLPGAGAAVDPENKGFGVGQVAPHTVYGRLGPDGAVQATRGKGKTAPQPGERAVVLAQEGDVITAGVLAAMSAAGIDSGK